MLACLGAGERLLEWPPRNTEIGKFVNFLFCTFCPIKEGFPKQLFEDFPRSPSEKVEDTHLGAVRSKGRPQLRPNLRGRGRSRHTWLISSSSSTPGTIRRRPISCECTSTSAKYLGYGVSTGRRSIRRSGMSSKSSPGRVVRCSCRPSQANKRWPSES